MPFPWGTDTCKCPAMESVHRIDSMDPMMSGIVEMIRDKPGPMVKVNGPMEVMQNEESGEPKVVPPERIGNPCIKVIIIRRRSVVCDYRRSLIIIIIVYYRSFGIVRAWVNLMGFTRCRRCNC